MFFFDINWCRISIVTRQDQKKEVFTEPPFRTKTKIQWASLNYLIMALIKAWLMMMMMMMMMMVMMMMMMMMMMLLMMMLLLMMIESIIILIPMSQSTGSQTRLQIQLPQTEIINHSSTKNNSWIAKWPGLVIWFFSRNKKGCHLLKSSASKFNGTWAPPWNA